MYAVVIAEEAGSGDSKAEIGSGYTARGYWEWFFEIQLWLSTQANRTNLTVFSLVCSVRRIGSLVLEKAPTF